MKNDIEILLNSGIELTADGTINNEIETRLNTGRKINRSLSNAEGGANNYDVFELPLNDLLNMKKENDSYLQMLYNLKKEHSPFKKEHSPFKNIVPIVSDKFDTGAIVYDSWGWDQTNIDYYCIVKRSGQFVTLLPMKKVTGPEIGFMTNEEKPLQIDFTRDPQRKKVKTYSGEESGFSMRDYAGGGWVSLYKGEPQTSTHYA